MKQSLLLFIPFLWFACSNNTRKAEVTKFTKIDSLTETYLFLQDSVLNTWNVIVNEENEKLNNLNELLGVMMRAGLPEKSTLSSLDNRLDQLRGIRITQKNLSNPYVVEEYDFASNSLISEVLALAESKIPQLQNSQYQELIDEIKLADQRVEWNRSRYDTMANAFNIFLDKNKSFLHDIDKKSNLNKKPLFKAQSAEDR